MLLRHHGFLEAAYPGKTAARDSVTLAPGQSGGSANGAGILFTSSAGTLSNGTTTGTSVIAVTNSS